MFNASVKVEDPGLIDAYAELLQKAPDVTNVLVTRTVNQNRDRLLSKLRTEPGPVVYPFTWKSAKQRRAFFATKGFGRGIGAPRTHTLVNAWHLIVVYQPNRLTEIALENNTPHRQYVTGLDQQPGHTITGWYKEDNEIDQARAELADEIEDDLIKSFYSLEDA